MSNKRHREETSEEIHTRHKKLRDDHGVAKRVDSKRYNQPPFGANINNDSDPFMGRMGMGINNYPLPQSDDDNDIDSPQNMMKQSSKSKDDTELGLLLYELASLDVKGNNGNNNQQSMDQPQTCPICSRRVSLKEFPDHVHGCLDRMDEGDLNDMRSQLERDSDFANSYARQHGYATEYHFVCPVCNVQLSLGMSMNEHVNNCLDESTKADEMKKNNNNNSMNEYDDDEDDDIVRPKNNNNSKSKGGVMSREQMIECASKLMTLQQGSEQFDNMLGMFGALGFNKANVKSVIEIEKKQKNKNNGNGNHNNRNNQNFNNMNYNNNMNNNPFNNNVNNNFNDNLSPIAEEDVDLNQNKNTVNFMNNDNRARDNNNQQQMNNDNQQYVFDDDDL